MKKQIVLSLILFSIEANIFCYSWRVTNNSDKDLIIELCTENNNCESSSIPQGRDKLISFGQRYNFSQPLNSVTIIKADETNINKTFNIPQPGQVDMEEEDIAELTKDIRMGGEFSIDENSKTGYFLSD